MLSRKIDIGFSAGASGAVPGASRGGREASGTDLGASGVATKLPPRTDTHIPAEFGTLGFAAQSLFRRGWAHFAHNASPSRGPPRLRHPWRKLPDRGGSFMLARQALPQNAYDLNNLYGREKPQGVVVALIAERIREAANEGSPSTLQRF